MNNYIIVKINRHTGEREAASFDDMFEFHPPSLKDVYLYRFSNDIAYVLETKHNTYRRLKSLSDLPKKILEKPTTKERITVFRS